jgi:hypothetical protein
MTSPQCFEHRWHLPPDFQSQDNRLTCLLDVTCLMFSTQENCLVSLVVNLKHKLITSSPSAGVLLLGRLRRRTIELPAAVPPGVVKPRATFRSVSSADAGHMSLIDTPRCSDNMSVRYESYDACRKGESSSRFSIKCREYV